MSSDARWKEIRGIHKEYRFFYEMLGGLLVLAASVLIGAAWFGGENEDYRMNLFTEGMGIVATVFIINRWYAHQERRNLKSRLIREAGSRSHDIAISAVEWMRSEGWLKGAHGLLKGAALMEANLDNAHLGGANLQNCVLTGAKLRKANLWQAELQNAELLGAKLQRAVLDTAQMQGSDLSMARLQRANLMQADLEGAELLEAKLVNAGLQLANLKCAKFGGADLRGAKLDGAFLRNSDLTGADLTGATLPDGTPAYSKGSDKRKFTDPSHPGFTDALEDVKRRRRELGLIE